MNEDHWRIFFMKRLMAVEYKNERIARERIGVFTGWKDFAVGGNQPIGRKRHTLLGEKSPWSGRALFRFLSSLRPLGRLSVFLFCL